MNRGRPLAVDSCEGRRSVALQRGGGGGGDDGRGLWSGDLLWHELVGVRGAVSRGVGLRRTTGVRLCTGIL